MNQFVSKGAHHRHHRSRNECRSSSCLPVGGHGRRAAAARREGPRRASPEGVVSREAQTPDPQYPSAK